MDGESLSADLTESATVSVDTDAALTRLPSDPSSAPRTVAVPQDSPWPWLLRWQPRHLLTVIVAILMLSWTTWVAVDAFNIGGLGDRLDTPLWRRLYDRGIVDVCQWVLLALAVVSAGYLGGRIAREGRRRAASFFLLLGLGLGLVLIEQASNIRRSIGEYAYGEFGDTLLGMDHTVLAYGPILAAVAVFPLYALVWYGIDIWQVRPARSHFIGGYALFALAAAMSLCKNVGGIYPAFGGALDSLLGGVHLVEGYSRDDSHAALIDAPVEETIEALAAALMLAMILAFAGAMRGARSGTKPGEVAAVPPADTSQLYRESSRSR